jgi:hypothetical protein
VYPQYNNKKRNIYSNKNTLISKKKKKQINPNLLIQQTVSDIATLTSISPSCRCRFSTQVQPSVPMNIISEPDKLSENPTSHPQASRPFLSLPEKPATVRTSVLLSHPTTKFLINRISPQVKIFSYIF